MRAPKRLTLRFTLLVTIAAILLGSQIIISLGNINLPIQTLELSVRDAMMRLRGRQPISDEIVIVAVDDLSLAYAGQQWPWPRAMLAELIRQLNQAGASIVGLDIFFFKESTDPAGDEALAHAVSESQAAVGVLQIFRQPGTVTLNLPYPSVRAAYTALGITSLDGGEDAISRSLQAFDTFNGTVYYNWAFELARLRLRTAPPTGASSTSLFFNGQGVPLTRGRLIVNFAGPAETFPTYSAISVLEGDVLAQNPDTFRGKIVLVGVTSITLHDLYPTPFSTQKLTPGVEIVANTVEMIMQGAYLREVPAWANLLAILIAALLAAWIGRSKQPSWTLIILGLVMAAYTVIVYLAFRYARVYLPLVSPQLMLFLGVILPAIEQAVSQELEKRRVRSLFTRFLSPEMVDQLIATQDINSLNKRVNLSILFSDIRGFTTLSEKLAPEEVVALLNPYLEAMTKVIYQHGGTVDKYEGDAIIAFFGEPVPYPDHALRAVRTAVDMRIALDELKARWKQENKERPNLEMGIGIHSGDVFVGLLGSAQRINYTVIGDTANLASRLQDLTKTYQWPILISESTQRQVEEEFETEFVDAVIVKGKTEPVRVYKVLGRRGADPVKGWK